MNAFVSQHATDTFGRWFGEDCGEVGFSMSSALDRPLSSDAEGALAAPHESGVDWSDVGAALRRYLRARTRNPQLADDLAQETLLRALAYQRENILVSPYAFSFRVAQNLLREHYSRFRPTESIDGVDVPCESPQPECLHEQRCEMEAAVALIRSMPPLRREVFLRRRIDGQSCSEIGAALGLSPKAVEKHITRALLDLQHLRAPAVDKETSR